MDNLFTGGYQGGEDAEIGVNAEDISVSPLGPCPLRVEGVRGKMGSLIKNPILSHVANYLTLSPTDVSVANAISNGKTVVHSDSGPQPMDTLTGRTGFEGKMGTTVTFPPPSLGHPFTEAVAMHTSTVLPPL